MKPQAFQAGEIRDEHDNIIREGAYGKKTPLANANNTGVLDYIINNFDVLDKGIKAAGIDSDENGNPILSPMLAETLESMKVAEANAKKSATAAKTSENNAKASENKAKNSETAAASSASSATTKASEASASAAKAKTSESTATQQATKATTEANRAKTEADRAKSVVDGVGNPVVDVTQSNGKLTITKGDGSSHTLTVTPPIATQAEAEAGALNNKVMTPLRTKEAVEKFCLPRSGGTVNGDVTINGVTLSGQGTKDLYIDGIKIYNADEANRNERGLELPPRSGDKHGGSIWLKEYNGYHSVQLDNWNNLFRIIGRTPAASGTMPEGDLSALWYFDLKGNGDKTLNITTEGLVATGSNYIRYASGLQICWHASLVTQGLTGVWVYPLAFSAPPIVIFQARGTNPNYLDTVNSGEQTSTQCVFIPMRDRGGNTAPYGVMALAIGYWK